ncbi:MAG: hypothetical protein LQ351_004263 [Letrouitia transgressa]|nr:MAG: hypothetical protein LQ351_004263 [Letrouitia transgressa]
MRKDQPQQHQPAAPAAPSADDLHDDVGHFESPKIHHLAPKSPTKTNSSSHTDSKGSVVPNPPGKSAQALSVEETSPPNPALDERALARQAALQRLNGVDSPKGKAQATGSVASTQPVLVREYSNSSRTAEASKQAKMKQKRRSELDQRSSDLPALENFSFQDILASIDPDIRGSIDTIAEICGRSKMSLADEYGSHLPPQGDLNISHSQAPSEPIEISRLEPVEEAPSLHEQDSLSGQNRLRPTRLSLVNGSAYAKADLPTSPVTATSAVASQSRAASMHQDEIQSVSTSPSYIPQILAWLRSSRDRRRDSAQILWRDSGAANSLQRLLENQAEASAAT